MEFELVPVEGMKGLKKYGVEEKKDKFSVEITEKRGLGVVKQQTRGGKVKRSAVIYGKRVVVTQSFPIDET